MVRVECPNLGHDSAIVWRPKEKMRLGFLCWRQIGPAVVAEESPNMSVRTCLLSIVGIPAQVFTAVLFVIDSLTSSAKVFSILPMRVCSPRQIDASLDAAVVC
ncbi:hypothetical protein OKW37_000458 [Paraburkholderia sp. MM5482-R2]